MPLPVAAVVALGEAYAHERCPPPPSRCPMPPPGVGVQGSGFRVQGSGFRVQGSGFRVQGSGFRVQGHGWGKPIRMLSNSLKGKRPGGGETQLSTANLNNPTRASSPQDARDTAATPPPPPPDPHAPIAPQPRPRPRRTPFWEVNLPTT